MSQKLVLPINQLVITASYKNELYKRDYKLTHYGIDCVAKSGDKTIYACGDGEVTHAGADELFGNCVVTVYPDVLCNDGIVRDLACRTFHFGKISVKAGDKVTKNTVIGQYGNTGKYSSGAHLHIEFDTDTAYPNYAVGIAASGSVIKRGTVDSTTSPSKIWCLDTNQSISGKYSGWYSAADLAIPRISTEPEGKEIERLKLELTAAQVTAKNYKDTLAKIKKILEEVK